MQNFNGCLISNEIPIFGTDNRSFRYGDGLFETIRVFEYKTPFLDLHKQRLLAGMKALKMNIPSSWEIDFIDKEVNKLLNYYAINNHEIENKQENQQKSKQGNFRLRFAVFRKSGGLYTPTNNEVDFCIEATILSENTFLLNDSGLVLSIFDEIPISASKISKFKTSNSLPYIMAAIYRQEQNTDDCFIVNVENRICESVSANIFGVTLYNKLITPPISEGCIEGIMRKIVLQTAQNLQIACEESPISIANLLEFKEVFITNAIQGIRWVSCCKPLQKYYTEKNMSLRLIAAISENC